MSPLLFERERLVLHEEVVAAAGNYKHVMVLIELRGIPDFY